MKTVALIAAILLSGCATDQNNRPAGFGLSMGFPNEYHKFCLVKIETRCMEYGYTTNKGLQ